MKKDRKINVDKMRQSLQTPQLDSQKLEFINNKKISKPLALSHAMKKLRSERDEKRCDIPKKTLNSQISENERPNSPFLIGKIEINY